MKRLFVFFFIALAMSCQTFQEDNGVVTIEAEETASELGSWEKRKGYIEFTGNTTAGGSPGSPITYKFKINKTGVYHLSFLVARDMSRGQPKDHSNDCYIRVEGDFKAGPNVAETHGMDANLKVLKRDCKFFGGKANEFFWTGDRFSMQPLVGGDHSLRNAVYSFKAGQTYKLIVSGRSQWFMIDKMVFRHASVLREEALQPLSF